MYMVYNSVAAVAAAGKLLPNKNSACECGRSASLHMGRANVYPGVEEAVQTRGENANTLDGEERL